MHMQLILIFICLVTVWSSVPSGYVPIPLQSCLQNPPVTLNAYASQWPVGSSTVQVSLYFQFSTSVSISGGNYTALVFFNGIPYQFDFQVQNQELANEEGISWPIPAGFSFEKAAPNIATVTVGQYYPVAFDIWSFDQHGQYLLCVSSPAYSAPSSVVSIPLESCASDPSSAVTINAWASNWPPVGGAGSEFVIAQITANQVISGGTYTFSVTTSLGTSLVDTQGNIFDIAPQYSFWPIPTGFTNQIGTTYDTTTLPPGATVSFQLTLTDQLGHEYLCLKNGNGANKSTSINTMAILVTLILTIKQIF